MDHLVRNVRDASEVDPESGVHGITLRRYREAIVASDGNKTRSEVNRVMAYCSKMTIEDMLLTEARRTSLPLEDIIQRLKSRLVKKSPPITTSDSL
jgi:hypothetical protein